MTANTVTYAFTNARAIQRERLRLLSELFDEGTFRVLRDRGPRPGWQCLEVGAGGGSVASWLCQEVGPTGSVLATDLDTTVLAEREHENLEVKAHDVLTDELPEAEFDLVHARLLLAWLADPDLGLAKMLAALKPGGCLVVEEMDFHSLAPHPRIDRATWGLFSRAIEAHHAVLSRQHAFDPFYGRKLHAALIDAGLADVGCEGRASMWQGGGPGGVAWQLTLMQLRDQMIESGLIAPAEVDGAIELCRDPGFRFMSQVTMAAWGYGQTT